MSLSKLIKISTALALFSGNISCGESTQTKSNQGVYQYPTRKDEEESPCTTWRTYQDDDEFDPNSENEPAPIVPGKYNCLHLGRDKGDIYSIFINSGRTISIAVKSRYEFSKEFKLSIGCSREERELCNKAYGFEGVFGRDTSSIKSNSNNSLSLECKFSTRYIIKVYEGGDPYDLVIQLD